MPQSDKKLKSLKSNPLMSVLPYYDMVTALEQFINKCNVQALTGRFITLIDCFCNLSYY